MSQETLFPLPEGQAISPRSATRPEEARVVRPVRNQAEMMVRDLDSLVPEGHPVRAIWAFLEQLNLAAFYGPIKAVVDRPGRPPSDPSA